MSVATYNPKDVVLTFGGFQITGYADGEFITLEYNEDTFQVSSGGDGFASRVNMNDNTANLAVTLAMTSPGNDILSGYHELDKRTGQGVVPVVLKDLSGRTAGFSASAWVKKPASIGFGKEISTREWSIDIADLVLAIGGNGNPIPNIKF